MDADEDDQDNKRLVVLRTDSVVQPLAVMIEQLHTSVALTAVLSPFIHIRIADFSVVLEIVLFRDDALLKELSAQQDDPVRRI